MLWFSSFVLPLVEFIISALFFIIYFFVVVVVVDPPRLPLRQKWKMITSFINAIISSILGSIGLWSTPLPSLFLVTDGSDEFGSIRLRFYDCDVIDMLFTWRHRWLQFLSTFFSLLPSGCCCCCLFLIRIRSPICSFSPSSVGWYFQLIDKRKKKIRK